MDREEEVDLLEPRQDFEGHLDVSNTLLRRGDRVAVRIWAEEVTLCRLARVFLPGCLALLEGGANAQTAFLPLKNRRLQVVAVAVRPALGLVQAALADMYDATKVGVLPALSVE